jgi:type II secretory pathway pseudopilin PulG
MHRSSPCGESGATLVLALVFVLVISLVLMAIVTLSGTNLIDTAQLQNARSLEYAADGGVDAAIQAVRYQPSPITACSPTTGFPLPATINGVTNIVVFCEEAAPLFERQVTFTACPSSTLDLTDCQNQKSSIVQAVVLYSDVKNGCLSGGPGCILVGQSATVLSWTVELANS